MIGLGLVCLFAAIVVVAKLLKRREMAWRHAVTGGVHVHARNEELKAFASQKRFEAKKR